MAEDVASQLQKLASSIEEGKVAGEDVGPRLRQLAAVVAAGAAGSASADPSENARWTARSGAQRTPLSRSCSDANVGELPSVWVRDLEPHMAVLKSEHVSEHRRSLVESEESVDIVLNEAHHLILTIHGIGRHEDFRDESLSWDGTSGGDLSGGFYDFKTKFHDLLGSNGLLKDLPISVHFESIEWHEAIRQKCNIESALNQAAPHGVQSLREFISESVIDGLLYLSSRFGQEIINEVAQQLNYKYHEFCKSHPGFSGPISVFAHSLGSLIIFDLLSQTRKDIIIPKLDFDVNVLFVAGSPLAYLHLSRGDLFDERGKYKAQYFLPQDVRVVNFFHPFDPVAWRLGPLLEQGSSAGTASDGEGNQGMQIEQELGCNSANDDCDKISTASDCSSNPGAAEKGHALLETIHLPQLKSIDNKSLVDILLYFGKRLHFTDEEVDAALGLNFGACGNLKPYRRPIDFALPTSRYERAVELASATIAHSSYWTSSTMVISVLATLAEPLFPVLLSYQKLGFSTSVRPRVKQTNHEFPVIWSGSNIMVEERVKGFWRPRFCIMQPHALFVFGSALSASVAKSGEIALSDIEKITLPASTVESNTVTDLAVEGDKTSESASVEHQHAEPPSPPLEDVVNVLDSDDSIIPVESNRFMISANLSSRNSKGGSSKLTNYSIGCKSIPEAHIWLNKIRQAVRDAKSSSHEPNTKPGQDMELFGLLSDGYLQISSNSRWSGPVKRWAALGSQYLRWYDRVPNTSRPERQLDLDSVNLIQYSESQRIIRLLYGGGGTLTFRFGELGSYKGFLLHIRELCKFATSAQALISSSSSNIWSGRHYEHLNSGAASVSSKSTAGSVATPLVLETDFQRAPITLTKPHLIASVTGHIISRSANGKSFANFAINILVGVQNSEGGHNHYHRTVFRRYSEFKAFHQKLNAEVSDRLPTLPSTSFIPSLDSIYLNRKVKRLNGYMKALSAIQSVQESLAWSLFLETRSN